MTQFGGAPRNDDYGYFSAPARPAAVTSSFGAAPVAGGQFGGPPTSGARSTGVAQSQPLPPGAHAHRGGRKVLVPLLVVAVLVLGAAGAAAAIGVLPGFGGQAAQVPPPTASPYTVKPPPKLLGWTLSHGAQARELDATFRSGGGFDDHPVATFLYTDGGHEVTAYGGVALAALTPQRQRAFMAGATSSLSADGQGISIGRLKPVRPGALGGTMRCTRLGTVPASTACVFGDQASAGVVVVLGRVGDAGVDKARAVRAAVVHRA